MSGSSEDSGGEREQTFEDDTKGTLADFPADAVVDADEVGSGGGVLGHGEREERAGQARPVESESTK